jgi:hypothetical protein
MDSGPLWWFLGGGSGVKYITDEVKMQGLPDLIITADCLSLKTKKGTLDL